MVGAMMWPPVILSALSIRGLSTLGATIVAGVTLLTIALLVLSRSRWGQVKPVSKCIALSVFAHLLLFIYAYDTELLVSHPSGGWGGAIPVSFAEGEWSMAMPIADATPLDPGMAATTDANPEPIPDDNAIRNTESELSTQPVTAPLTPEALRSDPAEIRAAASKSRASPPSSPITPPALLEREEPPLNPPADVVAPPARDPVSTPGEKPLAEASPGAKAEPQRIHEPATVDENPAVLPDRRENLSASGETDSSTVNKVQAADSPKAAAQPNRANEVEAKPSIQATEPNDPAGATSQVYANRQSQKRLQIALQYGGSERTEAAVNGALQWLAKNQSEDGRWDADRFGAGREISVLGHDRQGAGAKADTGVSALAVLAFLAAGETHLSGDYRRTVERGLIFLIRSQSADGSLAGDAELFARMYCHGMAMLALSEAYVMTGDDRLAEAVERAAEYTIRAQHLPSGGWRYLPGDPGDMSQFGWQLMALKSADLGGIQVPGRTWTGMRRFLKSASSGPKGALASYRPGERPSTTMTAEALACRVFLGEYGDSAILGEAVSFILQDLPNPKRANFYNWYYGTLALFQVQDSGWQRWNQSLQATLLTSQRMDGTTSGSWDPDAIWGSYGGRVYSTALGALCLEVYYRYLPLTQTGQNSKTAKSRRATSR